MENEFTTFLPGLDSQYKFVASRVELCNKRILVIGSESETTAGKFAEASSMLVNLIVEDYESLLNSKLKINQELNIKLVQMDFEFTDFDSGIFDLVYAQASISNFRKNKIIKEIKRILKPNGIACIGEITTASDSLPAFIQNIFQSSDIIPIQLARLDKYYLDRNFEILDKINLSFTLKDYYAAVLSNLRKGKREMANNEISYYKKLLNKISHEAKVYLNQGGDKYFGFTASLLKLK